MWLTPPHMKRKITDVARGALCGPSAAPRISPASAQSAPIATPKNPPPAWCRNARRETRPHGWTFFVVIIIYLSQINEFIQIEDEPRQPLQAGRVPLDVSER